MNRACRDLLTHLGLDRSPLDTGRSLPHPSWSAGPARRWAADLRPTAYDALIDT